MRGILDTNLWIYLFEGRPEIKQIKQKIKLKQLIPVLTPVIYTEVLGWKLLEENKQSNIRQYFQTLEILPVEMKHWEQVISWRRADVGKKLPDLLIGANAKLSQLPILTRNTKDFNRLGVEVEDPWVKGC